MLNYIIITCKNFKDSYFSESTANIAILLLFSNPAYVKWSLNKFQIFAQIIFTLFMLKSATSTILYKQNNLALFSLANSSLF